MCWQDEPNFALRLGTRVDRMPLSCPLETTRYMCPARTIKLESHIIDTLLTKLVRLRWLDIGLVLFCVFMDLASVSVHKHEKKKSLANIQQS